MEFTTKLLGTEKEADYLFNTHDVKEYSFLTKVYKDKNLYSFRIRADEDFKIPQTFTIEAMQIALDKRKKEQYLVYVLHENCLEVSEAFYDLDTATKRQLTLMKKWYSDGIYTYAEEIGAINKDGGIDWDNPQILDYPMSDHSLDRDRETFVGVQRLKEGVQDEQA